MNKKGLSYIDWSISIGIFVIFILALFILVIPALDRRLDETYLISIVETGFKENTYYLIYSIPLFIDHAQNDVFLSYLTEQGEALALTTARSLRQKGLKVETNLGVMKFKKLFKTAEGKGHKNVALIGEDEVKNNTITLKNMVERKQEIFDVKDIESITNFLKQG